MLNNAQSDFYEATKKEAVKALNAYPDGLQIGGGINADNAAYFINEGASHVIITSFGFSDGKINYENLEKLRSAVGKEHVVLDLSCRKKDGRFYIVTNRWQVFTDAELTVELLQKLSEYCDEFLVHAVDVEGKNGGIQKEVIEIIKKSPVPATYAGGISSLKDIDFIKKVSDNMVNITIGTALDIFGGNLNMAEVINCTQ